MATATSAPPAAQTAPIKSVQDNSEAIQKILSVPLVADSLKYAHSTIEAHPLISQTYHAGENILNSSLKAAAPITTRFQGQLSYVDHLALQTLQFAESKWAYPFHATSAELYDAAKVPAEQARSILKPYTEALEKAYGSHVRPVYDNASKQFEELKSHNAYVKRAVHSISALQANLQKTVDGLSARGKENGENAKKEAQNITNAIFGELDRVRGFALALPAESRKRFSPVLETFSDAYETLSKEAKNSELPPAQRFQNVLKYVREQSLPALQKAIVHPDEQQPVKAATATINGSK
ncbi:hypothetical protein K437DRAFT_61222 [Tilletiaria anomala UBC 951]|uniref:Lipid droplet-associated perilipin protein n=1 Tax=Tilletiaria anomala (strain ATCC 24038 / CBS 436.72 / UBC 951) TaxID=1037660 RepID=A0A066WAX8_TILAU|nr:uncharacterized protein K437DRAFT_61222 [Tilletiaria anomala UBC 951]KDN50856.1 hypothetical protein K437DRAFT_61222 [Tilletiaria anomala UBC 951]